MNKFLLATLFVAMVSCGISHSPARLSDTKTVLAEMDKDAFGSTIISAVALNAASGNPVEEIVLLIEEIVASLNEDQANADNENQTNVVICEQNIDTFTNQIFETSNTIDSTEKAIKENENILAQAKIDLAQADQDYEETVNAIQEGTQEREQQHSRWIEEDYDQQIQIATLEEGVKLINHMIHGVAFSQIKSRYDKVLENLSNNNSKHAPLFKPLISSLTQLATKLNYENVMKILDLLNNIRTTIVESRENARLQEEKAQADWEKLLAHLTSEKQRLTAKRTRLRALIESTETLLDQLRISLENNKVQLEQATQNLANTKQQCAEQAETYSTESDERQREISILERLLDHVREKYAQVSEYVSTRNSDFE